MSNRLRRAFGEESSGMMGYGGEGKKAYDEDQHMIREGAEALSRAGDVNGDN